MRFISVVLIASISVCSIMQAEEFPVVNMNEVLRDDDGKPIKDIFQQTTDDMVCAKCDDLKLGEVMTHAFRTVLRDDTNIDPNQRWAWEDLSRRLRRNSAAKLSGAEQKIIGDRIVKVYGSLPNGSLVIYDALRLIDPNRKIPEIH